MLASKEYKACIYTRLSRDDGDKVESDSIANQRALIKDFLGKHPEISIVSEKTDDGYSGVNFERPGFQQMMEKIRSGEVNCVVVKDLSRFGRNYIESGNYIEKVFPFMGVRFIAINDNYDSKDKNQADSLVIPFKNLINDTYCKDISVKIRSQLEIKRKKGEFIGAFAVYGYLKDPEDHNKLVVDSYASEVVRAIYKWKQQGMSQKSIAEKLNAQGVLCPMEYKISLGIKVQTNFKVHKQAMWSPVSVSRILTNEIYTGVLIQGKTGTPNYKVKKIVEKDKSDWIRIEDAHEPIIDRTSYELVQMLMGKDTRISPDESVLYPLSGFIVCADCGQSMVRKMVPSANKKYYYYICSTNKAGKGCSSHRIAEPKLLKNVLVAIQKHIDAIKTIRMLLEKTKDLPQTQRNVINYDVQIVKLKEEIERSQNFKLKLYENLQDGMITQDEYFIFKKGYADKIEKAEATIRNLEGERDKKIEDNRESLSWIDRFIQYENISELERKVVVDLIEKVIVGEDGRVEVQLNCGDQFKKIVEAIAVLPEEMRGGVQING